jgi:capsular exopolysaccharide synthesis family protein
MTDDAARESSPALVSFLDEGVVTPSRSCAIVGSLRDAHSIVGEELRLLRSRLRTHGKAGPTRCLALTSALPGEGKSTVALGLAAAFAREPGRRVLLVEADLRRPTVSENLGLPPVPGLSEWLNGGLDQVPIRLVQPGGFSVLVAGQDPLERPESLGSPLMDALLRTARSAFDDVLVDAPPLLPVADATLMQDLLDGFLLIVRSRVTPRAAILDALGRLRPEKVVGVVLNDHKVYRHSYSTYAYQKYGMSYGPRSSEAGTGRKSGAKGAR